MEHSIILLLLGLALVLATSSSLLARSGSGREDEDRDDSRPSTDKQLCGEIAGSVSVTSTGEVWITILIDELSMLAKLEVIDRSQLEGYQLSIAAVAAPAGEFGEVSQRLKPLLAQEQRIIEFESQKQAVTKITQMFDDMGIVLSEETTKSIPYAISCSWRTPKECQRFVNKLLNETKCNED